MNPAHIFTGVARLLLASLLTCHLAGHAQTLCAANEQVVFSCNTGKKIVSACASGNLNASRGYLQYRFGPRNNPELTFPAMTEHPKLHAQAKTLIFAGGGGAYLRFNRDNYSYVLYTAIGHGWGSKDGLVVEKDGRRISHLACKNEPQSMLGDEFFTKAGLPQDAGEFELP